MNRFVGAISAVVSARGAWLLFGVTTQAYITGLSAVWMVAGFIISETLLFLFLGPVIRKYSGKHACLTITDIFTSRFRDEKKSLRILVSGVLIFFSLLFISSQFMAGGRAFYAMLGLSPLNGVIITGIIVLLSVLPGGFKTLSYSDVFQTFIILAVLVSLPIIMLIRLEGFTNLHAEIIAADPDFFDLNALSTGTLIGFLSIGFGSPGNPNILQKYISVNNPKHFRGMTLVNAITNIVMAGSALCTGIFARVYFPASDSIPGANPQNVFIGLAGVIFSPLLLGVVLASIIGSIISSSGSQILVSASAVVSDLYEKTFNKGKPSSQASLTFFSRIAIVILVYTAILAGIFIDTDLYRFMLFTFAGLGASIGPAIILSLLWKDATKGGIMAGIITGTLTVIAWRFIPSVSTSLFEFAPGFILATLAIITGSKIDRNLTIRKYNRKAKYEEIKKAGQTWRNDKIS